MPVRKHSRRQRRLWARKPDWAISNTEYNSEFFVGGIAVAGVGAGGAVIAALRDGVGIAYGWGCKGCDHPRRERAILPAVQECGAGGENYGPAN